MRIFIWNKFKRKVHLLVLITQIIYCCLSSLLHLKYHIYIVDALLIPQHMYVVGSKSVSGLAYKSRAKWKIL